VGVCCEQSNEHLFSIKYGEFLDLARELLDAQERLCPTENLFRFCLFGYLSDLRLLNIPIFLSVCGSNEYSFKVCHPRCVVN
jgi:hypothetical protein